MKVKEITLLSLFVSVLFVQEQILSFIPNVQLTTFLIVLYTRLLSFKKVSIIIIIHVYLDNLIMGSLNLLYTPSMLFAWMLIPILLKTVFKNLESVNGLAVFGFFFGFVYGWIFIPTTLLLTELKFKEYLIADILFEVIMGVINYLTILWAYKPMYNILSKKLSEIQ